MLVKVAQGGKSSSKSIMTQTHRVLIPHIGEHELFNE